MEGKPAFFFDRIPSTDDAASTDSGSAAQKRRLSLSEVLSNQKKMRPSQQTVRHSFGRIAATGRRTFAPAAAGAATAAAAVDMKGVPSTSGSAFTFSEDAKDAGEEEEPAVSTYDVLVCTLLIIWRGELLLHTFVGVCTVCTR